MKIHLFPGGTIHIASVRIRCYNFVKELRKRGINCYISQNIIPSLKLDFRFPKCLYGRMSDILRANQDDIVIVFKATHQPLNPEIFLFMRKILGYKLIFDFDDAIFLDDPNHTTAPESTKKMIKEADGVAAGCEYLYHYATQHNDNVMIIRGNVDMNKYFVDENKDDKIIIGWLGSPGNHDNLNILINPLEKLATKYDNLEFKIITNIELTHTIPEFKGIKVKIINWDINNVFEDLQDFDIGIIPYFKSDWAEGKAGGKVLEYMAAGIPIVSTPIGSHKFIIEEGKNGFFADNDDEWFYKIKILIENKELRKKMGIRGREIAKSEYSIEAFTDNYLKLIDNIKRGK